MKQLSGIKVFRFGFLCYVALTVFLTMFFWFEQWSREFNNRVGIEKPNTESLPSICWEAFVENRE